MASGTGAPSGTSPLGWVDAAVIVAYFVALGWVAWQASKAASKPRLEAETSVSSYFLAERSVGMLAVAASLFSSNIGAEHFVGLAGTAAYSGVAVGWYEWGAIPCLVALGYFFLPVYLGAGISTVPEYLERRFNPFCKTFVVALSLLLYVFTKIAATLFAGQLILAEVSSLDHWTAVLVLVAATAAYTMAGGLAAVVYTEALQTVVLLMGGGVLTCVGLWECGGVSGLRGLLDVAGVEEDYYHIFRGAGDAEFPWPGMLVGYFCVSIWYWGCDQVIVQRAMSARHVLAGRAGCTGAAGLKLLPGLIMVLPGIMARGLMTQRGVVAPDSARGSYDRAFAWLVVNVVPRGARGLLVAAMVSALMSSLASVLNSSATLFSLEVWRRGRPHASPRELVWTGRVCVAVLAVLSCLWLPLLPLLGDQLFILVQKPASYIAPPILSVYLWGALSRRVSAAGATAALCGGVSVGGLRFLLEVVDQAALGGGALGADLWTPSFACERRV